MSRKHARSSSLPPSTSACVCISLWERVRRVCGQVMRSGGADEGWGGWREGRLVRGGLSALPCCFPWPGWGGGGGWRGGGAASMPHPKQAPAQHQLRTQPHTLPRPAHSRHAAPTHRPPDLGAPAGLPPCPASPHHAHAPGPAHLIWNMLTGLKAPHPMGAPRKSASTTASPAEGGGRATTRSIAPLYTMGDPGGGEVRVRAC